MAEADTFERLRTAFNEAALRAEGPSRPKFVQAAIAFAAWSSAPVDKISLARERELRDAYRAAWQELVSYCQSKTADAEAFSNFHRLVRDMNEILNAPPPEEPPPPLFGPVPRPTPPAHAPMPKPGRYPAS